MKAFIKKKQLQSLSIELATDIEKHKPQAIFYIETGGASIGKTIGRHLRLPCFPLDIRYSISRVIDCYPKFFYPVFFLVKEVIYKLSSPSPSSHHSIPTQFQKIALVDDTASSGKTIKTALKLLQGYGYHKNQICIGTIRCGSKAKTLVDCFVQTRPVVIIRQ